MSGFLNWLNARFAPWITALGLTSGSVTLEVRGRRSGRPIRVSVTRVRQDGKQYLVALYRDSQWARNVRAAGGAATIISRHRMPVQLVEIPTEARAPILLGYVNQRAFTHSGAQSARHFFGLQSKPTLADMAALAEQYPVFEIRPRPDMTDEPP
ncbi:nitroreductase/quinone reductase family protein [Promineifilum sp.]|uniref:nitroreductase/quinone reductase family protein n=1 Tax=Promineifilum sp. TaxID=2664178 RepID=UPI0035AE4C28